MRPQAALDLAGDALIWLVEQDGALERLLAASGLEAGELRRRAGDPEMLGFVLDFVLEDESLARGFAESEGLAPETLLRARAALPGGDAPSWT